MDATHRSEFMLSSQFTLRRNWRFTWFKSPKYGFVVNL